ncbi:MAG: XRE family transcriptional regulator [Magnetococcales bacterium]|nr:XRE family transcriptional regulator [Magnetococcales bacterium]
MNMHRGSSFDAFLEEEGILDEVSAKAQKRLMALQLADIMEASHLTKTHLAQQLGTSRSQLDRLLDPENTAITLESMERLAHAVGKRLRIEFADA